MILPKVQSTEVQRTQKISSESPALHHMLPVAPGERNECKPVILTLIVNDWNTWKSTEASHFRYQPPGAGRSTRRGKVIFPAEGEGAYKRRPDFCSALLRSALLYSTMLDSTHSHSPLSTLHYTSLHFTPL